MSGIHQTWSKIKNPKNLGTLTRRNRTLILYPYSLPKNLIREILTKFGDRVIITSQIKQADIVVGLKKHLRHNFRLKILADRSNIKLFSINQKSVYQVLKLLRLVVFKKPKGGKK